MLSAFVLVRKSPFFSKALQMPVHLLFFLQSFCAYDDFFKIRAVIKCPLSDSLYRTCDSHTCYFFISFKSPRCYGSYLVHNTFDLDRCRDPDHFFAFYWLHITYFSFLCRSSRNFVLCPANTKNFIFLCRNRIWLLFFIVRIFSCFCHRKCHAC